MTNVSSMKHLLNFQQPMNHIDRASPTCYWLTHWEIPTFQGKRHGELDELKAIHLYLLFSPARQVCFSCEGAKKKNRSSLIRGSPPLITAVIKLSTVTLD